MEKAILIGVQTYTSHSFEERMEEMKELALACDIEICMSVSQNLEHPHKKYYMNPGKIEEIKRILEDQECSMVLVLEAISPSVQRNLSDFFDCEVMDKSALILEIFASRAKTKESMLQVECARLKYLLPRLQGSYKHMDRHGSLTLAHSQNSQMSFMYGFFFVKLLFFYCCMCCNCDTIVVKDGCFYETVL